MALQSFTRYLTWPGLLDDAVNAPAIGARTVIDASGEYHAVVIQAREAMTLSHVGLKLGAVSGSPTADIRIETVGTDGLPTGTLWGTDTNVVTAELTTNWTVHALTAAASISKGDIFAVKVIYNSGTSFRIDDITNVRGMPFSVINTGTPTVGIFARLPWGLGSSPTAMYAQRGLWPINAISSANTNNTNGARRGMLFQVPIACRIVGARLYMPGSSTGDFSVGIWDNAGNEVNNSITAFDRSQFLSGGDTTCLDCLFDNPVTPAINTNYRLAIEPSSATNVLMYHMTVADAALRSGLPCGTLAQLTTFASGSWDDSATTTIPYIDLLIDQLSDNVGSGGLLRHPGMAGGMAA